MSNLLYCFCKIYVKNERNLLKKLYCQYRPSQMMRYPRELPFRRVLTETKVPIPSLFCTDNLFIIEKIERKGFR